MLNLEELNNDLPTTCDCCPQLVRTGTIVGGYYWNHETDCAYYIATVALADVFHRRCSLTGKASDL